MNFDQVKNAVSNYLTASERRNLFVRLTSTNQHSSFVLFEFVPSRKVGVDMVPVKTFLMDDSETIDEYASKLWEIQSMLKH